MSQVQRKNEQNKKEYYRRDINKGYMILYLGVFLIIIVGEVVLANLQENFSIVDLFKDIIGNLMGVLAAFLVFDIAHEKLSKDSYASEVSSQILDTMMYHPEALGLYENEQKKIFVNEFIGSIVEDPDACEMIRDFLSGYLLTKKDYIQRQDISDNDCRIRTAFSYRFVLDEGRTSAFNELEGFTGDDDPYFYVQEEIDYRVKYLASQGNNTDGEKVSIGFIYNNQELDRFLRGNKQGEEDERLKRCLFRESLDITEEDQKKFESLSQNREELIGRIQTMFRPHLKIDQYKGELVDVEIIPKIGIIVTFQLEHDRKLMEHSIDIIFHIPKKWNTVLEVVFVEPTKAPKISLSYQEDKMDVEMFSFLNKGESSSYDSSSENENGIYSISLSDEWVFPISGVVFPVNRKKGLVL